MENRKCKSFNAYNSGSESWCEFFNVDKCSSGVTFIPDLKVSYFDTARDAQCPFSKLLIIMFSILLFCGA